MKEIKDKSSIKKYKLIKILKICCFYLLKTIPLLLIILAIVFKDCIEIKTDKSIGISILCSLIPMIMSIIGISLSVQSEKIKGVTNFEFRRLRLDFHFTFLEMIIYSLIIFVFMIGFTIFRINNIIWILNIASLLYSLMFVISEVPLLEMKEKKINKIIKLFMLEKEKKILSKKQEKNIEILNIVLNNSLIKDGIIKSFQNYKGKIEQKKIVNCLFDLTNTYFINIIKDIRIKNKNINFGEIDYNVERIFEKLNEIFKFQNEFNLVKIYGDISSYMDITKIIFYIHEIYYESDMKVQFDQYLSDFLNRLLITASNTIDKMDMEFSLINKILNKMIKETLNTKQKWIIYNLKDNLLTRVLQHKYFRMYYFYLTMILYYYDEVDNNVPENIKDFIINYINDINESKNNISSFKETFKVYMDKVKIEDLVNYLHSFIKMYCVDDDDTFGIRYISFDEPLRVFYDNSFDYKQIVDCWIQLMLSHKYIFDIEDNAILDELNKIDIKYRFRVVEYILQEWYEDKEKIKLNKISYLKIYNYENHIYKDKRIEKFSKDLFKSCNIIYKTSKNKNYKEIESEINLYNKKMRNTLNSTIKSYCIYNGNIKMKNTMHKQYSIIEKNYNLERDLDFMKDQFLDILYMCIINYFYDEKGNLRNTFKVYDEYNEIDDNLFNQFNNRSNNEYIVDFYNLSLKDKETIKKIKSNNIPFNDLILWSKNALGINVSIDKNTKFYRKLTPDEINKEIDDNYKEEDGYYKCHIYENQKGYYKLTKDELYDVIKNNYIVFSLVFDYKIELKDNYIIFKEKNDI